VDLQQVGFRVGSHGVFWGVGVCLSAVPGKSPCIDQRPRYSCQFRGWLLKQNNASADSGDMKLGPESQIAIGIGTSRKARWVGWLRQWHTANDSDDDAAGWTMEKTGCGVIWRAKYHKLRCVAAITKSTNHGDMSFSEIKPNRSHEQTTAEQTEPFFYIVV